MWASVGRCAGSLCGRAREGAPGTKKQGDKVAAKGVDTDSRVSSLTTTAPSTSLRSDSSSTGAQYYWREPDSFLEPEPGSRAGSSRGAGCAVSQLSGQASSPHPKQPPAPSSPPFRLQDFCGIFGRTDVPPPAPTGKHSGLSATVLRATTDKPWDIGNSLMKFFSEFLRSVQVFVELLKPIPSKAGKTKYSLKVLIFVQSNWCQAKIRIYEESKAEENALPVYLIEFQRRSGDSLAFRGVYRFAEAYLQTQRDKFTLEARGGKGCEHAGPSIAPPAFPFPPLQGADVPGSVPECMLGPVLDLVNSKCLRYQAEGAIAIAEMAAEATAERPRQKMAWTKELREGLETLLEVQETIVAFPTVKALRSLARVHDEARAMAVACQGKLRRLRGCSSLAGEEAEQLLALCGVGVPPERGQFRPRIAPPPGLEGLVPSPGPPRQPGLQETTSAATGRRRVEWTVHASKLNSKDTQVSSPNFDLACGGGRLPFKLVLYPKEKNHKKGGVAFRTSGGKATVRIKCNGSVTEEKGVAVKTFWIYAGGDATARPAADPVTHDFSVQALCPLADDLDLAAVRDASSSTFTVCVEVSE